jgi:carbamoyltransferase
MNGYIWKTCDLKNIFVQPVSGDDGTTLGSAMAVYLENGGNPDNFSKLEHVYFGPSFSNEEIEAALKKANLDYKISADISKETAKLIADGKIIGWFQGRMEVGPRALGSRSILVDPRKAEMKDIVNDKVKFREAWRPFCPSILYERASDYLEKWHETPFMILTFTIKEDKRNKIPAVNHVDNTARPQLVKKEINPRYYDLIKEFENLTDEAVVLNTSFNIKGEPIVCTPEDAINCFLKTGIEVLAIGDFLVKK